ncbi:hypothetical protein ACQ4PT_005736 [Festuca glaucescens]
MAVGSTRVQGWLVSATAHTAQHRFVLRGSQHGKRQSGAAAVQSYALCQKEHLKFLRILLKDFMVISGVDTMDWSLMQFATAPKLIYHPEASYQICNPVQDRKSIGIGKAQDWAVMPT